MASILKVDKIRGTGLDSDTISLDGSGNITIPKNVTFTGTTTGAGAMVKLLDATFSSVAYYDITNTYINATYDEYIIYGDVLPATDNVNLDNAAFYGDTPTLVTATEHSFQSYSPDGGGVSTDTDCALFFRPHKYSMGNASGEGVRFEGRIQNANSTTQPYCIHGQSNIGVPGGTTVGAIFFGSAQPAYRSRTLRGIRIKFGSGNIASGYVKLYGIK
tara:strand:- start:374 stop:1024 length:651 start_codon:yes stop_codon:yes gene_type:complete